MFSRCSPGTNSTSKTLKEKSRKRTTNRTGDKQLNHSACYKCISEYNLQTRILPRKVYEYLSLEQSWQEQNQVQNTEYKPKRWYSMINWWRILNTFSVMQLVWPNGTLNKLHGTNATKINNSTDTGKISIWLYFRILGDMLSFSPPLVTKKSHFHEQYVTLKRLVCSFFFMLTIWTIVAWLRG